MHRIYKWIYVLFPVLFFVLPLTAGVSRCEASSCVIEFTAVPDEIKRGDIFTIVCSVSSSSPFLDVAFMIDYDDRIMQFIKGGKKVSGGYGELTVDSSGNSSETYKKTFSLQFMGKGSGSGMISVKDTAEVTDAAGEAFSVSSNALSVTVTDKGKKGYEDVEDGPPQEIVTPAPVLSGKNRLVRLETTAVSMTPAFRKDITEYSAVVDCETDTLYFSFEPENEKARVHISGNENLRQGENAVTVKVTAENGKTRKYRITVKKESASETQKRLEEDKEEVPVGSTISPAGQDRAEIQETEKEESEDSGVGRYIVTAGVILFLVIVFALIVRRRRHDRI